MASIQGAQTAGGHHPLEVNDKVNSRYLVRTNIYSGANSSVWLVQDEKMNSRVAAMKVLTADESKCSKEMEVAKHLQQKQQQRDSHPGKKHVIKIYDTFTLDSPNGRHHCIVTEVLGMSLQEDVKEAMGGNYPIEEKKKVASQVALGVAYLHKCGIVHGGISRENVLFYWWRLEDIQHALPIFGVPTEKCPKATFNRNVLIQCCLAYKRDVHVKMCDFGEASIYQPNPRLDQVFQTNAPVRYRPPEVLFGDAKAPAFSMDIWALGVLLFSIINDKYPFRDDRADTAEESVIKFMVMLLGRFPAKWWNNWASRRKFFYETGKYIISGQTVPVMFFSDMPQKEFLKKSEVKEMTALFYRIFHLAPEKRINAEEVVKGIPDSWKPELKKPVNGTQKPNRKYYGNRNN